MVGPNYVPDRPRRAEGDAMRLGDTPPKSEAEERVRGLMDALEESVAKAKEARDRKLLDDDGTDEWAAQFTDDEWDSVVASANTGSSEDYSHLDGDEDGDA